MKISLEEALGRLAEARHVDRDEIVANALLPVGVAYLERGRLAEAEEALDEARYLCGKMENPAGLAQVDLRLAEVRAAAGDFDAALESLRRALGYFEEQGDLPSRLGALERLGRVLDQAGRPGEAVEVFLEALALLEEAGDEVGRLFMTQALGPLYRRLGRSEEALAAYRELGRLADRLGDVQRVALALVGMGSLHAAAGRRPEALAALGQAREVYQGLEQWARVAQVEAEMERVQGGEA